MKMGRNLSCLGIAALLAACSGNGTGISKLAVTAVPTQNIGPTQQIVLTHSVSFPTAIQVPTYPPETRMQVQCLDVETTPVSDIGSSGILILENRASLDEGHYKSGTFQLDMRSGQISEITTAGENQIDHVASPNRSLIAYESITFNAEGKVTKEELVIADATGSRLKTIPWEEEWWQTPIWSDNEHLAINLSPLQGENSVPKAQPMLVLNPFTNERRILKPDLPDRLDISSNNLPYWEGRWGVIYDPTLTFAIYPRAIENNQQMYSYAIADLSKQEFVASLENLFASFSDSNYYPMPKWSPDGSRFVLQSFIPTQNPMRIELYEVSRDGKTRQLTNLSSVAYVWETSYSWSPNGRHIALFIGSPPGVVDDKAHAAILDMATLNITDYCVNITFHGDGYGSGSPIWSPIWSPDGHQFIITDWYEKDHRRVILVDIEKNTATQIADDMEPVAWMITP